MDEEYLDYEINRPGWICYRVRAANLEDAERMVNRIRNKVGTLMVDTNDWRFHDSALHRERHAIIEIYAEEE